MPVSSNGGGNLWSGDNECASDNWGTYTAWTWDWLFKNAPTDVDLHREGLARAKAWIAAHPGEFASLSLKKFCVLWYGDKDMAWWALQEPRDMALRDAKNDKLPPHDKYPMPPYSPEWSMAAQYCSIVFYLALVVAAVLGVLMARKTLWHRSAWTILPVLFLYFTLVHMVFESQAKYHYMLMPLMCIFAGIVLHRSNQRETPVMQETRDSHDCL